MFSCRKHNNTIRINKILICSLIFLSIHFTYLHTFQTCSIRTMSHYNHIFSNSNVGKPGKQYLCNVVSLLDFASVEITLTFLPNLDMMKSTIASKEVAQYFFSPFAALSSHCQVWWKNEYTVGEGSLMKRVSSQQLHGARNWMMEWRFWGIVSSSHGLDVCLFQGREVPRLKCMDHRQQH